MLIRPANIRFSVLGFVGLDAGRLMGSLFRGFPKGLSRTRLLLILLAALLPAWGASQTVLAEIGFSARPANQSAAGEDGSDRPAVAAERDEPRAVRPSVSLQQYVGRRAGEAMDRIAGGEDMVPIVRDMTALLDTVIAHGDLRQRDAFRDAAAALRLAVQLASLPEAQRRELAAWLKQHPQFAGTLAMTIRMGEENPRPILELVDRMRQRFGNQVVTLTNLSVAIAVVHDRPLVHRVNENTAQAGDPLDLFAFYLTNRQAMLFDIRRMPPELLIYVVDSSASVQEMTWALQRYRGDRQVGRRFFDVKYDFAHLRQGTPKQVTQAGFNLMNILRYGGVCADQAHFAAMVGKSIGVPTAVARGRSGNLAHAWIGFFEANDRVQGWNFDTGRYPEYQGIRGLIIDPQVGRAVPDGFVSLQAESFLVEESARHFSQALVDAAGRMIQLQRQEITGFSVPAPAEVRRNHLTRHPRTPDLDTVLLLLDAALDANAANLRAWETLRHLVEADRLSLDQIRQWSTKLEEFSGRRYPDFAAHMLMSMIPRVSDLEQQNQLWHRAFMFFRGRADIAAEIRLAQGRMLQEAGELRRAGQAYFDVIERFANDGPFVVEALRRASDILIEIGEPARRVELYAAAWSRVRPPPPSAYNHQSNYYVIGMLYARVLDEVGRDGDAAVIRRQIASLAPPNAAAR